jgi:hypothetical protein
LALPNANALMRRTYTLACFFLLLYFDMSKARAQSPLTVPPPSSSFSVKQAPLVGNWKISEMVFTKLPGIMTQDAVKAFTQLMIDSGGMRFRADSTFETVTPDGHQSGSWETDAKGKTIFMIKPSGVDTLLLKEISWAHLTYTVQTHTGATISLGLKRIP